jgi:hypothetical protein
MTRTLLAAAALLLLFPGALRAAPGTWTTDDAVGPNRVDFRLQLSCPDAGLVCSLIDGYDDTQTSTTTGGATLDLDAGSDVLLFDSDSTQDVGAGAQPAYLTLQGSDLTFANVPFAGVPELVNVLVFALSSPPVAVPGLSLAVPGDTPFSETFSYSGLADVFGDLEFILPGIVVPPDDVVLSGVVRVLGDVDMDGFTEIELRGVTGTFALQNQTTIEGASVTVDVTADLEMNLSGEVEGAPSPVPSASTASLLGLAGLLLASGRRARRGGR